MGPGRYLIALVDKATGLVQCQTRACHLHYTDGFIHPLQGFFTMTTYNGSVLVTRHDGQLFKAAWECWLGASEIATQVASIAWSWYIQSFFSAEAQRHYQWIGEMIACLVMAVYLAGVFTRRWMQPQVDSFVESCQAPSGSPEPQPEEKTSEPTPVVTEVAILELPRFETMGVRELRILARDQGIKGAARMRKSELLSLLR